MTDMIGGRKFKITKPGLQGKIPSYSQASRPYVRFLVEGVNHRGGTPIRFRSLDNAVRHMLNMRLALDVR